jgi:hypothetical protein
MNDQQNLRLRACELAEEVRAGRWDHIEEIKTRPVTACSEIVAELERRCPGFDFSTYQQAMANGLYETR